MVPRGGQLRVDFKVTNPVRDRWTAMLALQAAANEQLPFGYRLDKDGEDFRLVPVRGRNAVGEVVDLLPLLDHQVTVAEGTRTIVEVAGHMAEELSRQTGLRVSCCSHMAGYPWGMESVTYGADNLRARDVLKHLMVRQSQGGRWMVRCDQQFCFVDFR